MPKNETFLKQITNTKEKYDINIYEKILELRKFEIENFWKRTLFFWGTIALIYAGYFKANFSDFQIIIPLVGLMFNIIFSLSTRGSKYWQEHWETIAVVYENEMGFDLFKKNASKIISQNSSSVFTKPYRFSVSKLTMLLSDLSVILWFFIWIKELVALITSDKLQFHLLQQNVHLDWFTIGVTTTHLILILYFVLFLIKGNVYYPFENNKNVTEDTATINQN